MHRGLLWEEARLLSGSPPPPPPELLRFQDKAFVFGTAFLECIRVENKKA